MMELCLVESSMHFDVCKGVSLKSIEVYKAGLKYVYQYEPVTSGSTKLNGTYHIKGVHLSKPFQNNAKQIICLSCITCHTLFSSI